MIVKVKLEVEFELNTLYRIGTAADGTNYLIDPHDERYYPDIAYYKENPKNKDNKDFISIKQEELGKVIEYVDSTIYEIEE